MICSYFDWILKLNYNSPGLGVSGLTVSAQIYLHILCKSFNFCAHRWWRWHTCKWFSLMEEKENDSSCASFYCAHVWQAFHLIAATACIVYLFIPILVFVYNQSHSHISFVFHSATLQKRFSIIWHINFATMLLICPSKMSIELLMSANNFYCPYELDKWLILKFQRHHIACADGTCL